MRRILSLALAVLLSLSLAACGGDDAETSVQDDPNDGLGGGFSEDAGNDFSAYEGIWLGEAANEYDSIEFDADGNWQLYYAGDIADEGYLRYEPEWEAVYAYSSIDDSGSRASIENGQLYITSFGYFNYGEGMEYYWYEDGGGDHDGSSPDSGRLTEDNETDSWSADLYQRDVSEFEGVWYYDGDLSAETYIVIDALGGWSYYQRAPGAESVEMDCGTFSYSADEASTYYADSSMYSGVSYQVYELDDDVLIWGDEGAYYLME